jgi:hypothetical protein
MLETVKAPPPFGSVSIGVCAHCRTYDVTVIVSPAPTVSDADDLATPAMVY